MGLSQVRGQKPSEGSEGTNAGELRRPSWGTEFAERDEDPLGRRVLNRRVMWSGLRFQRLLWFTQWIIRHRGARLKEER